METDLLAILSWFIAVIAVGTAWRRRELLRRGRFALPAVLVVLATTWLLIRSSVFFS